MTDPVSTQTASPGTHRERADRVLVFTQPQADPFGTHYISSRLFAAEYLRWGFQPEFLDISEADDRRRAGNLLRSGKVRFVHCEQGRGLDLSLRVQGENERLFEHFDVPALAHVRDYAFCPWLLPRLMRAARTSVIFHTDAKGPDLAMRLGVSSGQHRFAPHVHLDYQLPGEAELASQERDIPFLYAGSYAEPEQFRRAFHHGHPQLAWAVDALIDAGVNEFRRPIHEILFDDILPARAESPSALLAAELLFAANQFIRYERRRRLFAALIRYPVQIIWAGPRPVVGGPIRADISPPVPLRETLALMCRAQRMVMTLNNFSHSLSERLLSAMSRGCIPVTQSNVLIDETFAGGDVLVRLEDDLAYLAVVLGQVWTVREFADRSAAAKRRVASAFSPATRVREFLTQMNLVGAG